MRCVLPACNHFYYFLALPSLFALSSRGRKYAPLLVTVSFQHLRSAVDASNYDVDGRNGSPGVMAFVSGTARQIGEEAPARRRPDLALPNPGTGSLGARGMPGREGAPAWGARPGRRPQRAARSPRRCSGGAVNVRSHLHGCPKFCERTVGHLSAWAVMHDRGGALAVIVRKDLC